MKSIELAKLLGQTIKEEPAYQNMEKAKAAYDADSVIIKLMDEYQALQASLSLAYQEENIDEKACEKIQSRLNEIYESVVVSNAYKALETAQNELNELLQAVNNTIMQQVSGKSAGGCGSGCGGCGGGCK